MGTSAEKARAEKAVNSVSRPSCLSTSANPAPVRRERRPTQSALHARTLFQLMRQGPCLAFWARWCVSNRRASTPRDSATTRTGHDVLRDRIRASTGLRRARAGAEHLQKRWPVQHKLHKEAADDGCDAHDSAPHWIAEPVATRRRSARPQKAARHACGPFAKSNHRRQCCHASTT